MKLHLSMDKCSDKLPFRIPPSDKYVVSPHGCENASSKPQHRRKSSHIPHSCRGKELLQLVQVQAPFALVLCAFLSGPSTCPLTKTRDKYQIKQNVLNIKRQDHLTRHSSAVIKQKLVLLRKHPNQAALLHQAD